MQKNPLVVAALVAALSGSAQTPPKAPPPGVEQALKTRVDQYYRLLEQAKYREAEAIVAEQSRDLFYKAPKEQIWGYRFGNATFPRGFKTADVEISYLPGPAATNEDRLRATGKWSLDDGQWFLALQSAQEGLLGKGPPWQERIISRHYPESAPAAPFEIQPQKLVFKRQGHELQTRGLIFKNHLSENLRVEVEGPKLPGLDVVLYGAGVSARSMLSFFVNYNSEAASKQPDCSTCKLPPDGAWEITIRVQPLNQTTKIQVQFE